tara:strand:- start:41 stop:304 length:264 start_codon:yes stop_codon:yes gene_type:complete
MKTDKGNLTFKHVGNSVRILLNGEKHRDVSIEYYVKNNVDLYNTFTANFYMFDFHNYFSDSSTDNLHKKVNDLKLELRKTFDIELKK